MLGIPKIFEIKHLRTSPPKKNNNFKTIRKPQPKPFPNQFFKANMYSFLHFVWWEKPKEKFKSITTRSLGHQGSKFLFAKSISISQPATPFAKSISISQPATPPKASARSLLSLLSQQRRHSFRLTPAWPQLPLGEAPILQARKRFFFFFGGG